MKSRVHNSQNLIYSVGMQFSPTPGAVVVSRESRVKSLEP